MKRITTIRLLILLIVVLLIAIAAGRNNILQWAFKRQQVHYKTAYHLNIKVARIKFTSWNRIKISGLIIQPDSADTLAAVENLEIKPVFTRLLLGKISFY